MNLTPESWVDLIAIGSFALIAIVAAIVAWLLTRFLQDPVRDRLESLAQTEDPTSSRPNPARDALTAGLARQLPQTRSDNGALLRELRQAGHYKPNASNDFLAFRNGLVILAVIVTGILAVAIGPERQTLVFRVLIGGLIVAGLCWSMPRVYLIAKARKRVERIRRALPDALDIMSMCMSGGIPMRDALAHVSREIYHAQHDLAVELFIVRQQSELSSLDGAFEQFADRINTPETTAMSTMISEGLRLGTSLVESVREFADSIRLKRRQLADEQAGKITIQLLFPVVLCLLPAAILYLWGPALASGVDFFQNFEGPSPEQMEAGAGFLNPS